MSQLEQRFSLFLGRHPEIRALFNEDIINLRALARKFMEEEGIRLKQVEATVAMIRRAEIKPIISSANIKIFSEIKISVKDEISILDCEKSKDILEKIKNIVSKIDYDKNETLKVAVGSHTIKIIVDSTKVNDVIKEIGQNRIIKKYSSISEMSMIFSPKAKDEKGIIAYVTTQLLLNGINILEIITCTPELIVYVSEEQSLKTYEVLKGIKNS